ncbi:ATP-binding protein [Fuerstiella marisgermanici]|uniref:Uncharacterized protein n=1 Tax=Fuerstiella marisgermanici TaxID=1891926 RepID=A0A1P8WDS6_9PLAN|nr:ATP-binding protein [Fuerstiella marisgermanici]APZ92238.1 hypothetical protein Fuma_01848 [Fuerstiella marisgermanici]
MSGRDGNRGYLVQTVIALLEALQSVDWHTVTLEPSHQSEKIDILRQGSAGTKATQVKSSIRQITKPNAERWAKELDDGASADVLELVLVGSCSQSVLAVGEIGRVRVPRAKNLDWKGLLREAAHLLDVFLHMENLASESPKHRELLVQGLVAQLSMYSSESRPLKRSELVSLVKEWLSATERPPQGTTKLSALSPLPRSCRSDFGAGLIGRDNELAWLQQTDGDKLISAQPGMGKTFLLQQYARHTNAFFLTGNDEHSIADAITQQQPDTVLIEDGALYLDSIRFLLSYRRDHDLSFEIIVDSWPGDVDQLATALGIAGSKILKLPELADNTLVEIIKASGIHGPNHLLHMIVHQSSGCPGRAMMLIDACLQKTKTDWNEVWTGEKLASWVRARFSDLIGESATEALACLSLGGSDGVPIVSAASVLGRSEPEVRRIVRDLALGGLIVDFGDGRLIVVPELLRGVLVRDIFFNSAAAVPITHAINEIGLSTGLVDTVIAAHARGARISAHELRRMVVDVDCDAVWRAYVCSTSEHAEWVIQNRPNLILKLSDVLLQSSPESTIPHLIAAAPLDKRPENQAPDHPIRRIRDWAQSGFPGREAVDRRKATLEAFTSYLAQGGDINLAAPLIPIIVSPQFDDTEQNPADRMQFTMRRGGLLPKDLERLEAFLDEIFEILDPARLNKWKPVLRAVKAWLFPHFGMIGVSDEQRAVFNRSGTAVLTRTSELAADRPGVLTSLNILARHGEISLDIDIDETFALLFPGRPRGDTEWKIDEQQRQWEHAKATGKQWADHNPEEVIQRVQWCIAESEQMLDPWPDHCKTVVDSIADNVVNTICWIDAIIAERARPDLITHLLVTALRRKETGSTERLRTLLTDGHFRYEAVQVGLVCDVPDDIRQLAVAECVHVPKLVDHVAMMYELQAATIEALLTHDDADVVSHALHGLWHAREKHPLPESLRAIWLYAATQHLTDEWCLEQALKTDQEFRTAWLEDKCRKTDRSSRYIRVEPFKIATVDLTEEMRCELIAKVSPDAYHATKLTMVFVGDSAEVYARLLEIDELEQFHDIPLARHPDPVWISLVSVATSHGVSPEDITHASRRYFTMDFAEVPNKHHREIGVWTELTTHKHSTVSLVAKLALKLAEADLDSWLKDERRDRLR